MLARTADSLFWMGRYMERAGNAARHLSVGLRMASLAAPRGTEAEEWEILLVATGTAEPYRLLYGEPSPVRAARWVTLDTLNPSSVASCFEAARRNGRAVRTALTVDLWEAVNDAWIDLRRRGPEEANGDRLVNFLDWVASRALLFSGAAGDTMLRDDAWRFVRLGALLERADNTARLLAAREAAFAPGAEEDPALHVQWQATLRAVSALRAYQHLFRERLRPERVAELLLARPEHPRSVHACYVEVEAILSALAMSEEEDRRDCRALPAALRARCAAAPAAARLGGEGLPDLLSGLIEGNARLGTALARCFLNG